LLPRKRWEPIAIAEPYDTSLRYVSMSMSQMIIVLQDNYMYCRRSNNTYCHFYSPYIVACRMCGSHARAA
jgi:hypothetical protein